ncbi:MAG: prepilin-type N-terminal cleavage/methylation domain-containing protein [Candidatus Eremiobacteraeota bacterium]|nr:prepilin-type N-terminal cleavage/methylation domain-containing protein [Candidatus Eremiobacteraeota bacterium]
MNRRSGFSIPELLIVSFIFSIFMVASYFILTQGLAVWGKTESSQNSSFQLQKVRSALHRDLLAASHVELEASGSELWFLTSLTPDGEQAQFDDGRPFWQRNVLYYLTTPLDHDKIFKMNCGSDPTRCSHKILVRKVLDTGAVTNPAGLASTQEALMSDKIVNAYALPTVDLYPAPENETVNQVDVIAVGLLSLSFVVDPKGVSRGEVEITVKGFDQTKTNEKINVGKDDLHKSQMTEELKFSVFLPD